MVPGAMEPAVATALVALLGDKLIHFQFPMGFIDRKFFFSPAME